MATITAQIISSFCLKTLRSMCSKSDFSFKAMVTAFAGSSISPQLDVLKQYPFEKEVFGGMV